jgi:poly(3-hydroxybutyrate) depolymerase
MRGRIDGIVGGSRRVVEELHMNVRTLCIVSGISAVLLGGACSLKLNLNQNYDETKCAGYLGCSAGKSFGVATAVDAGMTVADTVVVNSGCGMPLPDGTPTTVPGSPKGYKQFTVQGTGLTLAGTIAAKKGPRTFWVRVPADYDPTKHYRLVYIGQGCGGYNSANSSTWQLFSEAQGGDEEAIYVAIDLPTDMANMDCYDNEDGPRSQEWQAFQLFHYFVDSHYCVDENRIYIAGYSTGGWLSNMWGCYFAGDGQNPWNGVVPAPTTSALSAGTSRSESIDASMSDGAMSMSTGDAAATDGAAADGDATMSGATDAGSGSDAFVPGPGARMFAPQFHIRGQASVSGGEPPNNPPCNGSVAGMWIHDAGDNSNPISGSQKALARVLKMNSCENSRTMPWHPEITVFNSVCTQYIDCPTAYPVVFCKTNGEGHGSQPQRAIPGFKLFFDQVEAGKTP